MEFRLGPEIISSYKRLSYTPWYALAEFIDNSTQAYFDNKTLLNRTYKNEGGNLTVTISLKSDALGSYLEISDNSIGMSEDELQNAVIVGRPSRKDNGRSKYGIGLKTAACWFGDFWTIETKKLGENEEIKVEIDVHKIAANKLSLKTVRSKKDTDLHYTVIKIRKLNRNLQTRTIKKIKDYLKSFYRIDITKYNLQLLCFGEKLKWDYDALYKRILMKKDGKIAKKDFKFRIDGKIVEGWAGVLERGSRADAGFSIIQADRVIKGWPDSYRPTTLFGSQEGGRNDLVNQRLMGEIKLNGFDVSHTKDEILFSDTESEELEAILAKKLSDLKYLALSHRKNKADERTPSSSDYRAALNEFEKEISSTEIKDLLRTLELPSIKLIQKSKDVLKNAVIKKHSPNLKAKINSLIVKLYLVDDMSPNDPYVLIESTQNESEVIIIINLSHPHWFQLKNQESILNFIRHCTYDGVAEWKAYFKESRIDPDTIKMIKDNLLRLPLEIEKNEI